MAEQLQNYIDGTWVDAVDGERFDVFNPATGEVVATAPHSKQADADRAIDAARRTFDEGTWWPRTSERERGRILLRAAEIVRRERDRLAEMESVDSGKPIGEAREDIDEVAFMFEYFGGWATKIDGEIPPVGPDAMTLVVKEPIGVAVCITPWNEGVPNGVLNVITGFGETAGAPLVASPLVDKVGFTGSRDVGKIIMKAGADTLKRVTLELGGKSPNIVFADAEFEAAMDGSANGIFWNQGEICSAGSRVFVEKPIYDDALSAMSDRARQVRLGYPLDEDTTMGPLVSEEQRARVERYIEVGQNEAKLAVMGERPKDPKLAKGYYVPPTIFADVKNDARIAREEIFGPVMSVIPFTDVDEVIRLSNDNDYGLAAAVWTRDIKKAINTARALRAGIVWINDTQPAPTEMPWGGYKQSGVGRELGKDGVEDYLEKKSIYINLAE